MADRCQYGGNSNLAHEFKRIASISCRLTEFIGPACACSQNLALSSRGVQLLRVGLQWAGLSISSCILLDMALRRKLCCSYALRLHREYARAVPDIFSHARSMPIQAADFEEVDDDPPALPRTLQGPSRPGYLPMRLLRIIFLVHLASCL